MSRYRKIETRMWADSRFRELSSPGPSGKYLFIYLLTGPQTNNIPGLCRAGEMALAEELGWSAEAFQEAFGELSRKGLAEADWRAHVVWVRNAIKYSQPESPNVVKSWRHTWDEIPECPLKSSAHKQLKAFMEDSGPAFAKAFAEACPQPLPNQEQEQKQEQNINTLPQTAFADTPARPSESNISKPTEAQLERLYGLYPRKRDKLAAKKAIRKAFGVVMAGDPDHPAMPLDEALDYLAQRVTLYARCVQGCDREFVPYPASWFNAGGFWDDERDWSRNNKDVYPLKGNGNEKHKNGNRAERRQAENIAAGEQALEILQRRMAN